MEKKTMGLEKYIRIYDNIISLESVSAIIRTFKDSEFIQAKIIKDDGTEIINEEDRKVGEYPLGTNKSHTETHWLRYLSYRISQAGADFTNKYKYVSQIKNVTNVSILKYEVGGHYNKHVDCCPTAYRELSFILMLNDDYKGGALQFFDGEELIKEITPKGGRLIVWPSNTLFPHKVVPIISGKRYVVVSWMY